MTGPVRLLLLLGLLLALASPASAAETGPLGQLRSRALARCSRLSVRTMPT